MKRIAIVNDIAGVAQLEVAGLRQRGWEVDFFDLPKPGAAWPQWAKILVLPVRLALYLPIVLRLRRGRYDLVHVHFVSQGVVGAASGRPYVLHAHGSDLHLNLSSPLLRWWSRLWMKRARAIFYVTPNLAAFVSEFNAKAWLLPNPVDIGRFAGITAPDRVDKVLVFMRLAPIKGAGIVFAVADQIVRQVSLAALDWGPMAGEYKRLYENQVEFLEPVGPSAVPELLARFDAVIGQMEQGVPGLSELEALAAGRVVLMRLDEALFAGEAPPVVNVRNGTELVTALERLHGDTAEVRRASEAGRTWAQRHHGQEAHIKALTEFYGRALGSG